METDPLLGDYINYEYTSSEIEGTLAFDLNINDYVSWEENTGPCPPNPSVVISTEPTTITGTGD